MTALRSASYAGTSKSGLRVPSRLGPDRPIVSRVDRRSRFGLLYRLEGGDPPPVHTWGAVRNRLLASAICGPDVAASPAAQERYRVGGWERRDTPPAGPVKEVGKLCGH